MPSPLLDERIRALEEQLNCKERLEKLEKAIPGDLLTLHNELHPATALSHQSQILAPIIYRKQAVLASRSNLERDMARCNEILQLLLIGQPSSTTITETSVVDAPIVVETATADSSPKDPQVEATYQKIVELQGRANAASHRLDHMMQQYQTLIAAVSETLALAHEKIALEESTN